MSGRRSRHASHLRAGGDDAPSSGLVSTVMAAGRRFLKRIFAPESEQPPNARAALIGLDVARTPLRLKTRSFAPIVAAALAGALLLAVLRIDVIRVRFGLADSLAKELQLEEEKRRLTVEMRKLRDPAALSRRARELGFKRAEQLIDLPGAGASPTRRPREERARPLQIEMAGRSGQRDTDAEGEALAHAETPTATRARDQHAALSIRRERGNP